MRLSALSTFVLLGMRLALATVPVLPNSVHIFTFIYRAQGEVAQGEEESSAVLKLKTGKILGEDPSEFKSLVIHMNGETHNKNVSRKPNQDRVKTLAKCTKGVKWKNDKNDSTVFSTDGKTFLTCLSKANSEIPDKGFKVKMVTAWKVAKEVKAAKVAKLNKVKAKVKAFFGSKEEKEVFEVKEEKEEKEEKEVFEVKYVKVKSTALEKGGPQQLTAVGGG